MTFVAGARGHGFALVASDTRHICAETPGATFETGKMLMTAAGWAVYNAWGDHRPAHIAAVSAAHLSDGSPADLHRVWAREFDRAHDRIYPNGSSLEVPDGASRAVGGTLVTAYLGASGPELAKIRTDRPVKRLERSVATGPPGIGAEAMNEIGARLSGAESLCEAVRRAAQCLLYLGGESDKVSPLLQACAVTRDDADRPVRLSWFAPAPPLTRAPDVELMSTAARSGRPQGLEPQESR